MSDIKIDTGKVINRIQSVFQEMYPDSRDVIVSLTNIKFDKGISEPYMMKLSDQTDIVADYIKKAKFTIDCEVHTKYNPHIEENT